MYSVNKPHAFSAAIAVLGASLGISSCAKDKPKEPPPPPTPVKTIDTGGTSDDLSHDEEPPPPPPTGRPVVAYVDGKAEEMREPQALEKGLTVVDLSNYWVPYIFSEKDSEDEERKPNEFRPIFRKLSNDWHYESRTMAAARKIVERRIAAARAAKIRQLREEGVKEAEIQKLFGLDKEDTDKKEAPEKDAGTEAEDEEESFEGGLGEAQNFLEVFGIPPSFSVLRKRVLDEIDRECYSDVDFEAIRRFDGFVAYRNREAAISEAKKGRTFARKMRSEMEKLGISDPLELTKHPKSKVSAGLVNQAIRYEALAAAQKLLLCEGLYAQGEETKYWSGGFDWKTHQALLAFERKNRIFGWGYFGRETLESLRKTPKERLFDSFMRVISERVVDAAHIIEDGSARGEDGESPKYKDKEGEERTVRNLVAEFTAAMLRHMDLGSPDKVVEFLKSTDDKTLDKLFVAVPLPEKPPYYADEMELFSVINRGDVWYDYPYTEDGRHRSFPRKRMPTNTLYVRWNEQEIPLVTMNTTIGSWRTELASDGYEYYKYKNSDVGERVWKDIVAGPVWLPPETTPASDLVKVVRYKGRQVKVPNYDEFGPWYASAYGLVAAFHVREVERKNGEKVYFDNGIRSHGSVDYNSILRRFSHGCHRLYNHLAIRLFDFVLRHRQFVRVGQVSAGYSHRIVVDEDGEPEAFVIDLDSKGYKYELVNPVPVNVLSGRIRGRQRSPIETYMPKPDVTYGPDAQFLPPEHRNRLMEVDGGLVLAEPSKVKEAEEKKEDEAKTTETSKETAAPTKAPVRPVSPAPTKAPVKPSSADNTKPKAP